MKRLTITASIALCLISLLSVGQCEVSQLSIDNYIYSDTHCSQSFISCRTAEISHVNAHIHSFLAGDTPAAFHILSGDGLDGDTLYSQDILLSGGWGDYTMVTLENGPILQNQQSYTLVFEFTQDYGACWVNLSDVEPEWSFYWSEDQMDEMELGFEITYIEESITCNDWVGGPEGVWSNAENWSTGEVPTIDDCVTIGSFFNSASVVIEGEAFAGSLVVDMSSQLTQEEEATLHIGSSLELGDGSILDGTTIMENVDGNAEFIGDITSRRMKIHGDMSLWYPLTILDLLDLSDGMLMNFGTALTIRQGTDYKGHIYYPLEGMAGQVTLERHDDIYGHDVIAAPVGTITKGVAQDSINPTKPLLRYTSSANMAEIHDGWVGLGDLSADHNLQDSYLSEGTRETIMACGEVQSADMTITSINGGEWRSIANPYASILDWNRVERTAGVSEALHQWDEASKQFSVYHSGLSLHQADNRIRPMEAFFVRIPEGQELNIDYSAAALTPQEIYDTETILTEGRPLLKLDLSTSDGSDEMMIELDSESSTMASSLEDAWKVPSLIEGLPTIASLSSDAKVLAINRTSVSNDWDIIPLYVTGGGKNDIIISATLIEHFIGQEDIYLEDRLLSVYHNLFTQGAYVTQLNSAQSIGRFYLHLSDQSESTTDYMDTLNGPDENSGDDDSNDDTDPASLPTIQSVGNEIHIDPAGGQFPYSLENASSTDDHMISSGQLTVHDTSGRLVYSTSVELTDGRMSYSVPARAGYYMVNLALPNTIVTEKVFLH